MTYDFSRRGFIGGAFAFGGIAAGCISLPSFGKRWYKGNLHMHSFWSDGQAFPEEAVQWYKSSGYNFVALTDHNVFQHDADRWITVVEPEEKKRGPKRAVLERYQKAFPDAETRTGKNGETQVRLKTFEELAGMFDVPGEFLMLPGVEATRSSLRDDGQLNQLHMNYVNLPGLLPSYLVKGFRACLKNKNIDEFLGESAKETAELAEKMNRPHLFTLNHPFWTWYDIGPEALIANPSVRFFELCNNGSQYAPAAGLPTDGFDTDRFWDVVNAFRVRRGEPLLYGIGTDDTHHYHNKFVRMCMPGNAWTLVRASRLSASSIVEAMLEGDFVTCEMLEPEDVCFDRSAGRLEVSVAAQTAVSRTIRFIVTKKDFSEKPIKTVTGRPVEKNDVPRFARVINVYDEKIGMTVKTVKGGPGEALSASYTLQDDDLYVRARIEEDGQPLVKAYFHPQGKHVAWTQPYMR